MELTMTERLKIARKALAIAVWAIIIASICAFYLIGHLAHGQQTLAPFYTSQSNTNLYVKMGTGNPYQTIAQATAKACTSPASFTVILLPGANPADSIGGQTGVCNNVKLIDYTAAPAVTYKGNGTIYVGVGGGGGCTGPCVTNFNGRNGDVTLSAPDVQSALATLTGCTTVGFAYNPATNTCAAASGSSHIIDNGTTITFTLPTVSNASGGTADYYAFNSLSAPDPDPGEGGISVDSSGNMLSADAGGPFGRICNTLNGLCAGSGGLTQLTGDVAAGPGSGSQVATLPTVNSSPGSCGDSNNVCIPVTNAKGLVVSQSTAAIGVNLPTANLMAYYRFNQTSGTTLKDYSGNAHDGTITDAPTCNGTGCFFGTIANNIDLPAALNPAQTFHFIANFVQYPYGYYASLPQLNAYMLSTSSSGVTTAFEISGTPPPGISPTQGVYGVTLNDANGGYLRFGLDLYAGTHVISVTCNVSNAAAIYIDGHPATGYQAGYASGCNQTTGHFRFGPNWNGAQSAYGITYYGAALYSTIQTPAQILIEVNALRQAASTQGALFDPIPFSAAQQYAFFTGDSITCGFLAGDGLCNAANPQTFSANSYPVLLSGTLNTAYTTKNFGVSGQIVQGQIANAPALYAPLCRTSNGSSVASIFEGTNNIANGEAAATVWDKLTSFPSVVTGCRPLVWGMISRNGGNDTGMVALNTQARAGWRAAGFLGFVDIGADPIFGIPGDYANTTYYADGVHLTLAGQTELANAARCVINAMDGSAPNNLNPTIITAGAYTETCADGGVIADASSNIVTVTMHSAEWLTGRNVSVCNRTATGSNAVTISAPGDFPFNNISGETSITVANGTCQNFQATFNGNTGAPGDFWLTTGTTGSGGGGGTTNTIASGTAVMGTSAITTGTCATAVTVAGSGIATTDAIQTTFNSDPTAVTGYTPSSGGMLTIIGYPTSGNVNYKVCNNTAGNITPGAITLNWRVVR